VVYEIIFGALLIQTFVPVMLFYRSVSVFCYKWVGYSHIKFSICPQSRAELF